MDESSSGQEIANVLGNILRSINDAGYELRRSSSPDAVPESSPNWFEQLVTDGQLQQASGPLFRDRHFARAVEEAFKCLNNAVKDKSGRNEGDGASLMQSVFSVNTPILLLNEFQSQSERDEQLGYMQIFAGSMTGIRNPRAHDHELVDEPVVALELLVLANHLMRKLDATTKREPPTPSP